MRKVFTISDYVITSLGFSTDDNFNAMLQGRIGIQKVSGALNTAPSICLSSVKEELLEQHWKSLSIDTAYTRFEKLAIIAVSEALSCAKVDISSPETVIILSSTKGNVELINPNVVSHDFLPDRLYLWKSAELIGTYFGNPNSPIVVSHACVSGVTALITAHRYLAQGVYKHAVVCGVDVLSDFIISGFNSLKALSTDFCTPYDKTHAGLNLGEGAAAMVLTTDEQLILSDTVEIKGGSISNDANHISGPSRTGEGLYRAIKKVMNGYSPKDLAFINAHGTATVFNDDMESMAISRAGLSSVPLNGLKGYFGHTLGAAGVVETALSANALLRKVLPGTAGFSELGTPEPLSVFNREIILEKKLCLKTASGFGGCNAVLLMNVV